MTLLKTFHTGIFISLIVVAAAACSGNRLPTGSFSGLAAYPGIIEKGRQQKKDFILSSGVNVYSVLSVQLDKNKRDMTLQLSKVDTMQLSSNLPADTAAMTSGKRTKKKPSIVLLQMKDSASYTLDEPHTIPLANILKIEVEN